MSLKNLGHGIFDPASDTAADATEVRRQEALLNAGALQSAIFNSVNFSIIATDAKGVIQIFNVGAERLLGYAAADVMNKITPADISDPQEVIARADALGVELGTPITPGFEALVFKASRGIEDIYELTYIRKDGSRFPAVVSVTALRDDHDAIIGYLLIGTDNTARKQVEAEQKRLDQRLRDQQFYTRSLIESNIDAIMTTDPSGIITDVNKQMEALTGCTRDELIGAPFKNYFTDPERAEAAIKLVLSEKKVTDYELTAHDRDGKETVVSFNATTFYDRDRRLQGVFATARDITERKKAEESIQAASVFTIAREGIMITAADGTIININDAFTRITGYSRSEVLGKNPRLLSSGRQNKEFYTTMFRDLVEKGHWYGEVWNQRKNGDVFAVMETIIAVRDTQGNTQQYVSLFSDITALKAHQKELEHIAHYDPLTSLPNRVLLADRLHQGMAQAQRRGQMLAVAFLDLDAFKAINDNHGHEAGDQLLIALAARMKLALREGDTLSRLGGDEFVAVLLDLADVAASVPMLTRLLAAAAEPVQFDDITIKVSASLGVTFYPQANDVDADQLLRQADQAMYQAKQTGKNRYHVFDAEQDRNVRGHHESLERIRRALSEREFVLYYQPKVNMRTGAVIGIEALIRWQHPEQGLLPPAAFLPVIEDHPLAIELGEWVLDTALSQMAVWQSAGLDIPVSVNIGARQLQQADFVERLREILAAHPNVRPGDLELEVLETSALGDLPRVSAVIEACREIGVMFALDDFGTGYSSLTYLKRLPVTQLKIDQSFVRNMLDDPDDLAILEGVVDLAAVFRRQVIAEGVETVEHGAMLLQLGCELAQGYGIAPPMLAANLPSWSAAWRPDPAWVDLAAVSRDDLPLLFARAEHCAWILAIEALLKGEREARPPLDQHQCRFGMWLDAQGMARYGVQPAFLAIEPLHRQVHELAVELLELQARGRGSEALARLGELHGLRDALLEQLKTLMQKNRQ